MKSVALNIGANSDTPSGRAPIFADGSFRYIPITEADDAVSEPTYRDLGLSDVRPETAHDSVTHFDPEFPELEYGQNYTYGDRHTRKTSEIAKLNEGDILFFYATLDYADDRDPEFDWINEEWGAYIIGHFTLDRDPIRKDEYDSLPPEVKNRVESNAHFRREEFDAEYIVLGDPSRSQLYDKPIPLSEDSGTDANRIVTSLSEDSGAGPWYRRPLPFDEEATEKLWSTHRSQEYDALLHTERFLDFAEAKSFSRFVSLRGDWYQLWQTLENSDATQEARLLGTFVYIAGGNNHEVVREVLNSAGTLEEAVEKREELQSSLNELYRTGEADKSNHRKYLGGYTDTEGKGGDIMEAVETFYENVDPSFEAFLEAIQSQDKDPFDVGLKRLRRGVASYGRLTAFDQLELWQQLHDLDWLAPTTLRKSYVSTAGPKRGFKRVFGVSMDDLSEEEVNAKLQLLHDYAINEVNMNPTSVVYELESALCNYQKEDEELDEDPTRDTSEPC
ncbi:hypothetical protein [Natranaeroarchaeum aerophilus]|uniref:Nucleotide modification associated domain-containing protein n=1 Tax=Natranaeroarchaeum aerophilus TaxID=2917711 RepID=A0AAE3FUM3_9EURY|nr:hypothetical protein [Natranaeroarchaeum aerophilus]MCL9815255.1 hypothetical protein [Natranaeroarchaeum aerophilus]